jgi:uridine phosphorylase
MERSDLIKISLTEFDNDRSGLVQPPSPKPAVLPEYCVILYHRSVIVGLENTGRLEKIHQLGSVLVPTDIFQIEHDGKPVTVVCPTGCGAPLAGALLEDLIALGCRRFVVCGSAGVLKSELHPGMIVIPDSAIRDEGTSFHYLPPSRTIRTDVGVVSKLEAVLKRHQLNYAVGLTWTTDGVYRETRGKIARRKAEGCLTVEMECSALLAVARFREVKLGQYLLAGDDVSGEEWDSRDWHLLKSEREQLFWLSVEACLDL